MGVWGRVIPTHRPPLPPRKDPVPIVQEAGWAPRAGLDVSPSNSVLSPHSHSVDDFRSSHLPTTDYKLYLSTLSCCLVPTLVFVRVLLTNVGILGKQLLLRLVSKIDNRLALSRTSFLTVEHSSQAVCDSLQLLLQLNWKSLCVWTARYYVTL